MSVIKRCNCTRRSDGTKSVIGTAGCPVHGLVAVMRERDTALTDRVRLAGEVERLRLQVTALENNGMELAAKLGEAEEQIARLTVSGRQ